MSEMLKIYLVPIFDWIYHMCRTRWYCIEYSFFIAYRIEFPFEQLISSTFALISNYWTANLWQFAKFKQFTMLNSYPYYVVINALKVDRLQQTISSPRTASHVFNKLATNSRVLIILCRSSSLPAQLYAMSCFWIFIHKTYNFLVCK